MRCWPAVVGLLLASCGGGRKSPTTDPATPDGLWKLAPLTATQGIVVSDRGVHAIEAAWVALHRGAEVAPELEIVDALVRRLRPSFDTTLDTLESLGLAGTGGAAAFSSPSGASVVVLPVSDRNKFVAAFGGTSDGDVDQVAGLTCKHVGERYACAFPAEALGRLGGGDLGAQAARIGTRGDVELIATLPGTKEQIAAAIAVDHGGLSLHGTVHGASMAKLFTNAAPHAFDATKLGGFGLLNLGSVLSEVPDIPLIDGIALPKLLASTRGPLLVSFPGGLRDGELRVPLKDVSTARSLVEHCDEIPYLAILSSRFSDGVCHLHIAEVDLDVDVDIQGTDLRARAKNGTLLTAPLHPSPLATELAGGTWAAMFYGRGNIAGTFALRQRALDPDDLAAIRVMSLLTEVGVGVRTAGDAMNIVIGIRTIWSNPDDVVRRWLGLPLDALVEAPPTRAMAVAASAPSSPLASDLPAGTSILAPMVLLGVVAGMELAGSISDPTEPLEKMTEFKDAMCACKDAECAKRVTDDMTKWSQDLARRGYTPPALSEEMQKHITQVGTDMGACLQAVMLAPPDPAAYIAKNVELKDRLCACKDIACAEAVSRELTTWSESYVAKLPPGTTMSPADDRTLQAIESDMQKCTRALRGK